MIPRYTRPVMEKIWNERNEWQTMLDVEIAACEANAELGRIPTLMSTASTRSIVRSITTSSLSSRMSGNM